MGVGVGGVVVALDLGGHGRRADRRAGAHLHQAAAQGRRERRALGARGRGLRRRRQERVGERDLDGHRLALVAGRLEAEGLGRAHDRVVEDR